MKLSISNIGWTSENDLVMYEKMNSMGFEGLEIAPTRVFPENPYDKLEEAEKWAEEIKAKYGFDVPSMQSIWYGRTEKLFGTKEEREALVDYTKKAIDFATATKCKNLVFGCPRNRNMPEDADYQIATDFFREIGDYAAEKGTVVGMEANPPIYNTNFINDTQSALKLIEDVASDGFKLNLDMGMMIENGEDVEVLKGHENCINHVHVSEPGLKPVVKRELHNQLAELLKASSYKGYVSIEVGCQEDISELDRMMKYVKEVFGE
ncbi:sugar phosphate isomerase/epimerase family protein [Pseudobutyrivibrio sp. MD2005]|uniref:sugar phosphate isomerase/epimerase family protein n=1 Tax=Pseudobutyrivibrio sp. MD2005 TaxID=1410616 RepID=UPI0004885666|nr:sugar phosphate isomerase/epimerase family protein [Pseudobutyrivibrio sp. MD2005]